MRSETIIRVVYNGATYDLDIDSNIPLRIDISNVENQAIGKFFGVGSQQFELPGTKNNNRFFKHGYNVGATSVPGFYNSIPGYIITNGETLLDGQFQLIEIVTDDEGYVTYKCRITDQVVTFNDVLADKLIKNADWSALDHTLTYENILDSWDDNLVSGSVYYPLAFYGFDDPNNIQLPWFAFTPGTGSVGNYLNNSLTPIQAQQLLPAVKVKDTLDVIFDQVGYRYTGSFQSTQAFDKLFILPKAQESLGIVGEAGTVPLVNASQTGSNQIIAAPGPGFTTVTNLNLNNAISDPVGVFDTANHYYSTSGIGNYTFQASTWFYNPTIFTNGVVDITLRIIIGSHPYSGTVIASETLRLANADGFNLFNIAIGGTRYVSTADEVWLQISYTNVGGSPNALIPLAFATYFQCIEAPQAVVGANVNMGLQFGGNTKSIDILNGLIKKFNLILTPVKGEEKLINIDTFDDWIRRGRTKDWTRKYDTAKRISINHTVDEQPKELTLSDVDDVDRFSKQAIESDPYRQYGSLRLLADNNVSMGSKKLGDYFAPTVPGGPIKGTATGIGTQGDSTFQLDTSANMAFPHLYKFENSKVASYAFKPRIGYKVQGQLPNSVYIGPTGGGATQLTGSYSTIANVSDYPAIETSQNLWYNPTYTLLSFSNNLDGGVNAFDRYWKTYLDSLYWEDAAKVTMDLQFSQNEYYDIYLNDKIFIKDTYYRINKISGFNVTDDDTATVELIKLYPAYFDGVINRNCFFDVEGFYSVSDCVVGPTPTPFPTATAPAAPTPSPTPNTNPVPPTPTPTPTGATFRYTGRLCGGTNVISGIYSSTALNTGDVVTVVILGQERCYEIIGTSSNTIYPVVSTYSTCSTCLAAHPAPTPTPTAGIYYAIFEQCESGFTIQVYSNSPIPTNYAIGSGGLDCYYYLIAGGNGANGDYNSYTQYTDCISCFNNQPI